MNIKKRSLKILMYSLMLLSAKISIVSACYYNEDNHYTKKTAGSKTITRSFVNNKDCFSNAFEKSKTREIRFSDSTLTWQYTAVGSLEFLYNTREETRKNPDTDLFFREIISSYAASTYIYFDSEKIKIPLNMTFSSDLSVLSDKGQIFASLSDLYDISMISYGICFEDVKPQEVNEFAFYMKDEIYLNTKSKAFYMQNSLAYFISEVNASAVPIPVSIVMLSSGLVGILCVRKRHMIDCSLLKTAFI